MHIFKTIFDKATSIACECMFCVSYKNPAFTNQMYENVTDGAC